MPDDDQPQTQPSPETQGNQPETQIVEVARHDVTLTMDDLLTPLSQTHARLAAANFRTVADPVVAEKLGRFTELVNELRSLTSELDQADPTLFESKPGPAPQV